MTATREHPVPTTRAASNRAPEHLMAMAAPAYALVTQPERFALTLLASLKRQIDEPCPRFRLTASYFAHGLERRGMALGFDPDELDLDELNPASFVQRLVHAGVLVALTAEQLPASVTLVDNWFVVTSSLYAIEMLCIDDDDGEVYADLCRDTSGIDKPILPGFGPDDHPNIKLKPSTTKTTDPGTLPIAKLPEALHDLAIRRDSAIAWLHCLDRQTRDNEHAIGLLDTEVEMLRGRINNSNERLKELSHNKTSAMYPRQLHRKNIDVSETQLKVIYEQLKPLRGRRKSLVSSRKEPELILNALLHDIRAAYAKLSA